MRNSMKSVLIGSAFFIILSCPQWMSSRVACQSSSAVTVRIGVVAYEEFGQQRDALKAWLHQISASRNPPVRFQIALGSYSEIAHWMKQGSVDAALLTGGGYAWLTRSDERFQYVATLNSFPATGPWASAARKDPGFHGIYYSVCVTGLDAPVADSKSIVELSEQGKLRVLLVDPRSASGNIIPRMALEKIGVKLKEEDVTYTYSHSQLLQLLARDKHTDGTVTIGFVWDDACQNVTGVAEQLKVVNFPELGEQAIPHDAFVLNSDFPQMNELLEVIQENIESDPDSPFRQLSTGSEPYETLGRNAIHLGQSEPRLTRKDMQGIGKMLLHAYRNQSPENPFRLAFVLSGGGAKCAYQVGAVSEIENAIATINANNDSDISVDLVVGTSGGAINAVPVAMGMSSTPEGQETWESVWMDLDQRKIVLPARSVRMNVGIWLACLQMLILIIVLRIVVRGITQRNKRLYRWALGLGATELILYLLPITPWTMLGHNHLLHHVWLWLALGAEYTAITMLLLGVMGFISELRFRKRSIDSQKVRRLRIGLVLTVASLGLPLLQIGTMFLGQTTLSTGDGMVRQIYQGFLELTEAHVQQTHQTAVEENGGDVNEQLKTLSKNVVTQGHVHRDLILTATAIAKNRDSLPSDLYFYLPSPSSDSSPQFWKRGINMGEHPQELLNIVLGSSSIYPAFPGRQLQDVPQSGDRIELVDGGFAHNAPLEAAVLWGATHIILIDAAPPRMRDGTNLADSMLRGFGHLFRQSQLSDQRSRDQVVVFSLEAQFHPRLCVLDFANVLIREGIRAGRQDVLLAERHQIDLPAGQSQPAFVVTYGQPQFMEVVSPVQNTESGDHSVVP